MRFETPTGRSNVQVSSNAGGRKRPVSKMTQEKEPLGFWFGFFFVLLILGSIFSILPLAVSAYFLTRLGSVDLSAVSFFAANTIILIPIAVCILNVALLVLFIKRKRIFPKLYVALIWAGFLYGMVGGVNKVLVIGNSSEFIAIGVALIILVVICGLLTYWLLYSKKSKKLFVN